MNSIINQKSFFASSLTRYNKFQSFRTFHDWLNKCCRPDEIGDWIKMVCVSHMILESSFILRESM